MELFWSILIALVLLILLISYYFSRIVILPRTYSHDAIYQRELEHGRFDEAEWLSWEKEEIKINNPIFDINLYGYWLPIAGSNKTVILSHGITINLNASIKYIHLFRKRGFNVLIYDIRHHGKSDGKNTAFGLYEKYDLKKLVDWVKERVGEDSIVGTHGESMGAAISLQHAAIDPRVDFVISDCAFADLISLLRFRMKTDYHLPGVLLLPIASLMAFFKNGLLFQHVHPAKDLEQVTKPILFIHGEIDRYIPPSHAQRLYDAKSNGFRKLYLSPNAKHAESLVTNPDEYDQQVGDFLAEIL